MCGHRAIRILVTSLRELDSQRNVFLISLPIQLKCSQYVNMGMRNTPGFFLDFFGGGLPWKCNDTGVFRKNNQNI